MRRIPLAMPLLVLLGTGTAILAQTVFTEVGRQAGVADSVAINVNAAWGDFDNDGFPDLDVTNWGIYLTGRTTPEGLTLPDSIIGVPHRLYHNNGDGTFTDMSVRAPDDQILPAGNSSVWGDYDNDGDLDLYVANGQLPGTRYVSRLYRNNGDGSFTEEAASAGVANQDIIVGNGLWGDLDRDGWLDLYVSVVPYYNSDGSFDLAKSVPSRLYRNNRDGTFTDVASAAGVDEYGYNALCVDYNNDGLLDIYLPSPYFFPNPSRLYRNNGNSTYTDVVGSAGLTDLGDVQILSAAWGDFNNDGWPDLYKVNNNAENQLYRSNGDGTFTDATTRAGVGDPKSGLADGASWADYDNDGYLDLFVTNIAASNPCRLFHNNGDETFAEVGVITGVNSPDGAGAAWADYDRDGFLDLFVTVNHFVDGLNFGGPNLLYHNEGNANHWLVAELRGTVSNRCAIGARVTAVAGRLRQYRDVEGGGGGYASQPSLPVEFGFGSAAMVDSLIIRWPSGVVQTLTQVPTNQYLVLAESRDPAPTAVTEAQTAAVPAAFSLAQNYPNPFNGGTQIRFELPAASDVDLVVCDLAGQQVATLAHGSRPAGTHALTWDGRDDQGRALASGVYLCRLRAGAQQQTRKLVVVH